MKKINCWGIFREIAHSPNRESDDEHILRSTAKKLKDYGVSVSLFHPDEIKKEGNNMPHLLFLMCEELPTLDMLQTWEKQGIIMINSTEGVRNTYRNRMVDLLSDANYFPESSLVETSNLLINKTGFPCWVKRGDVHATQEGDVVLVQDLEELSYCAKRFNDRGIKNALLQKHIEGDLIKFYGVGVDEGCWFHFFYHKNQILKNCPLNIKELKNYARKGAMVLGLEIFGGDAIVDSSGKIQIIDLNAWPSFALFREEASTQISDYIISKIGNKFNLN